MSTSIPADLDAEKAVLGSCMIDPDMLPIVRKATQPTDYFRESNGWMFGAMCSLYDKQLPIDYHMLSDELRSQGHEVPGAEIIALIENTPTSLYADHYAAIVAKHARRRRQIALAQKLAEAAYDDKADPSQTDLWLKQELINQAPPSKALMTWEDSFDLTSQLRRQFESPDHKQRLNRWAFPWMQWNRLIDPMEPGLLLTLAAGDSVGKTTVMECCGESWTRKGNGIIYVHFELNEKIMMERRLCRTASVPRRNLITNNLDNDQRERLDHAERSMMEWPGRIEYVHAPGFTMEQAIAECQTEVKRLRDMGYDEIAIMIDYLDKAQPSPRQMKLFGSSEVGREADNVTQIKNFSECEGVRMVMATQMNKEGKQTKFEDLRKENIRGAGQKSEFANIVVILHKDKDDNGQFTPALGVIVDKNTLGTKGRFWQRTTDCFNIFDLELRP